MRLLRSCVRTDATSLSVALLVGVRPAALVLHGAFLRTLGRGADASATSTCHTFATSPTRQALRDIVLLRPLSGDTLCRFRLLRLQHSGDIIDVLICVWFSHIESPVPHRWLSRRPAGRLSLRFESSDDGAMQSLFAGSEMRESF
jgi:hypothetical protein